jgi:HEAT repeat protein
MRAQTTNELTAGRMKERAIFRLINDLREGDNFQKDKAMEQLLAAPDAMTIEHVAPLLTDPNTGTRMFALEILKKIGSCDLEVVVGLLNHENEDVRVYGCEILADLREPDSLPHLVRKIYEDGDNVRHAAAIALGEFNDERAVAALLDALKDVDWIAFSAIYSLGKAGSRSAVPPLLELFKDGEKEVSMAACEVLMGFHEEEVLDRVSKVLKGWGQAKRDAYMKIILEKGDENVFFQLKKKVGKELFEHLLNCIRYENKRSLQMMKLIAHFPRAETCEVILDTLKAMDPDGDEYGETMDLFIALRNVWQGSVSDYLRREEEYQVPFIKACSLAGIEIGEALLFDTFAASSAKVRREIICAVPSIGSGNGRGLLREAIKDPDGHVKGDAVTVIGTLGFSDFKEDIVLLSREGFLDVRIKALRVLVGLDRGEGLKLIKEFVNHGTGDDKKVYLGAAELLDGNANLSFVEKLLTDSDEAVRRTTVAVVGNFLDDRRYVNLVRMLLKSDNIPHEVLKVIKDKALTEFRERLIEIFVDPDTGLWTKYYALSALGAFEDHTLFEVFLKGLADENSLIKIASLKALSDLKDARALEYVQPFTLSDDADVRSTAEFVMTKLKEWQT